MKNSHKFFLNKDCAYFPCHQDIDSKKFNCLFCFCPLYFSGDKCGGHFKYSEKGVKNCADCSLPHLPEYYDEVIAKLKTYIDSKKCLGSVGVS